MVLLSTLAGILYVMKKALPFLFLYSKNFVLQERFYMCHLILPFGQSNLPYFKNVLLSFDCLRLAPFIKLTWKISTQKTRCLGISQGDVTLWYSYMTESFWFWSKGLSSVNTIKTASDRSDQQVLLSDPQLWERPLSQEYRSAFRHLVLQPSILKSQKYLIICLLQYGFYITNPKFRTLR